MRLDPSGQLSPRPGQEYQHVIQGFGAQRILQHATTTLASYDYKGTG